MILILLLILTLVSGSMWNTRNDPIYEPSTGMCYYESYPDKKCSFKEMISMLRRTIDEENVHDDSFAFKVDYTPSTESTSFSNQLDYFNINSPQTSNDSLDFISLDQIVPSPKFPPRNPRNPRNSRLLYVPERCRDFDRMWNLFIGKPEDLFKTEIIGWISRIAFLENIIQEMHLPTGSNDHYTIYPHRNHRRGKYMEELMEAPYLTLKCPISRLFHNLYRISQPVDTLTRHRILAVTISFSNDMATIKIILQNTIKEHAAMSIYYELSQLHPGIEFYHLYKF